MSTKRWALRAASLIVLGPMMAAAQTAPAGDQPRPLGRNLSGEDCVLAGGGNHQGIFCGGVATPAADISMIDARKDPKDLLEDEATVRALAAGLSCTGPVRQLRLPSGVEGAMRGCAGGDGWPRFVLAARRDRTTVFAAGHMTAFDLAQRVVAERGPGRRPPRPRPATPATCAAVSPSWSRRSAVRWR